MAKGIPGLAKAALVLILGGFTAIGCQMVKGCQMTNAPDADLVKKLASQIVDPNVSPKELQKQGYFAQSLSGLSGALYVDDCREQFGNVANASVERRAEMVTDCAQKSLIETAAVASANTHRHRRSSLHDRRR